MRAARVPWVYVGVFVVVVNVLAYVGKGLLTSPLHSSWNPAVAAEASPLARWDAGWYRSIAESGYFWDPATGVGNVTFLPLFPLLVRGLAFVRIPFFLAATLLSYACLAGSVVMFQRLQAPRTRTAQANSPLLALLTFPWAFFLLAPYSESLFLALALATFLTALRGSWGLVACLGFLAGLTRLFGLALVPPLLLLALRANPRASLSHEGSRLPGVLAALTPVMGFASFASWLAFRFRDPLLFIHAQQRGWGRRPGWPGFEASLQAIVDNVRQRGWLHLGPAVDLLVFLLLIAAVVHALRSRAFADAGYVGAGVTLIAVSGSLLSSGRYALVLFPVFGFLAVAARRPVVWFVYLVISSTLQAYLVVRFVNDLWVA